MSDPVQLVWFKRDLRITDHAPLFEAAKRGRILCLYIYEPEVLNAEDYDSCHLEFVNGCLRELRRELQRRGGALITRVGEALSVLQELHKETSFSAVHSHQETGNGITYARDLRVKNWLSDVKIPWHEYRQQGVFRALETRDGWSRRWNADMRESLIAEPPSWRFAPFTKSRGIRSPKGLGLSPSQKSPWSTPGSRAAHRTLEDFLYERGERYQSEMSSPLTGEGSCSRLSPYLAYGAISMRETFQAFERRREEIRAGRKAKTGISADWSRAMSSFNKRLHWNGHFIQRLESEPRLEFENMASVYDGMREAEFDEDRFEAWCEGRTGYPMVDACMRYLRTTGWLNFRMRAMLVSFASYHLWLHWRPTGLFLARQFIDYEPGIHYSQLQMQSGTTGINAVRIYSPTKQAQDQDPDGEFIRRWVPELEHLPSEHIATPWQMSPDEQRRYRCRIGVDYPGPIVDHLTAVKAAKSRVYSIRGRAESRREAQAVLKQHGSRRKSDRARRAKIKSAPAVDASQ